MHWLTIVIFLFLLLNAWSGWRKGLVLRVLELAGLFLSIFLAQQFTDAAGSRLFALGVPAGASRVLGWLLIFGIGLVATRLIAWIVSKAVRMSILGWLDKWGGALLGIAGGLVLGSILLMLAIHAPGADDLPEAIKQNAVPRFVFSVAPTLYEFVSDDEADVGELWDRVRDEMENLEDLGRKVENVRETITEKHDDD